MISSDELYRSFREGYHSFGMAPFWFWNGPLDEEEVRRQVRLMAQARLPAFTISGRTPLETPYLSDAWLQAVRAACEEADHHGLRVWIYDELNCPSGRAGRLVLQKYPHLAQKFLIAREIEYSPEALSSLPVGEILGAFACERAGETLLGWRSVTEEVFAFLQGGSPPLIRPRTALFMVSMQSVLDFYPPELSLEANVDVLDPEAVGVFLEVTYEAYFRALGDHFGKTLAGFFTDEPGPFPGYISSLPPMRLPWTPDLEERFQEEHSYDLCEKLPLLFLDHGQSGGVRQDFWQTLTGRFRETYVRRLREWCEAHGVLLIGHFICETPLRWQVASNGAILPLLSEMHWPGIDSAGKEVGPAQQREALAEVKMVASVARQMGRERGMSEIFSRKGWHQPLSGRKLDQDWECVLGADFFIPHALYYTLKGKAKRIKPLTNFYQQPYWPHYGLMAEYFARLCYLMSQGQRQADILLLMPTDSLWATQRPQDMPWKSDPYGWVSEEFTRLSEDLMTAHLDHDYGDETLLEEIGRVEGEEMVVGDARYKAVVIPPAVSIQGSTLDLITEMAVQGGKVIAIEPLPTLLNGRPPEDGLLDHLLGDDFLLNITGETFEEKSEALQVVLENILSPAFRLTDAETGQTARSLLCQRRSIGEAEAYFLVNTSPRHLKAYLEMSAESDAEGWNLSDGSRRLLPAQTANRETSVELGFAPHQSRLVVCYPSKPEPHPPDPPLPGGEGEPQAKTGFLLDTPSPFGRGDRGVRSDRESFHPWSRTDDSSEILPVSSWEVAPCGPNALILDFCRFALGETPDFGEEIIGIWEARAETIRVIGEDGPQTAWLEFEMDIADPLEALGSVSLCVEDLRRYEVYVNDQPVLLPPEMSFFVDISVELVEITPFLCEGGNILLLKRELLSGEEIEPVFLTGDFGVESVSGWEMFERADFLAASGWLNPWRGDYTTDGTPLLVGGPFLLTARLSGMTSGAWADQGFPFYAGTMAYQAEVFLPTSAPGERLLLALEGFKDIIKIWLNDREAATLVWPPYECDITDFMRPGPNRLKIEVTNTLRNLFGPHHHKTIGEEPYLFIQDGLPELRLVRKRK